MKKRLSIIDFLEKENILFFIALRPGVRKWCGLNWLLLPCRERWGRDTWDWGINDFDDCFETPSPRPHSEILTSKRPPWKIAVKTIKVSISDFVFLHQKLMHNILQSRLYIRNSCEKLTLLKILFSLSLFACLGSFSIFRIFLSFIFVCLFACLLRVLIWWMTLRTSLTVWTCVTRRNWITGGPPDCSINPPPLCPSNVE